MSADPALLVARRPPAPVRRALPPLPRVARDCPLCWAQRAIWEPGPLGLVPVVCEGCNGRGRV